jgi:hypothetical protein
MMLGDNRVELRGQLPIARTILNAGIDIDCPEDLWSYLRDPDLNFAVQQVG